MVQEQSDVKVKSEKIVTFYTVPKGTHERDFTVRFPHFLALFNKRQGRGPEFFVNISVKT
jgi:hypothetical protein